MTVANCEPSIVTLRVVSVKPCIENRDHSLPSPPREIVAERANGEAAVSVVTKGFGFVAEADLSSEGYGQRGGDKFTSMGRLR